MIERKSGAYFLEPIKGYIRGLAVNRFQGEGVLIKGFGQIYFLRKNRESALLAFQSPTDFNSVELQTLRFTVPYRFSDTENYIIVKNRGDNRIWMKLGFPKEVSIYRQEDTKIDQNLSRPIK